MISVVIPMYNSKDSIIETLNSVVNQTAFNLIKEIIVVDDGSTDDSNSLVKNYIKKYPESKVSIVYKENGGVSSARNLGIKVAQGEWIALLDADDIWLKDKIEKQVKCLNKYNNIVFLGGGRNNEIVKLGKKVEDGLYKLNTKDLLKKYWPHTSSTLIKKEILFSIGMFDENRKYVEDGQLWLKISSAYELFYLSDIVEIAGNNKRTFGVSGLSANLLGMHKGCISNIQEVYDRHEINIIEMYLYKIYEYIKFTRRIILTRCFK